MKTHSLSVTSTAFEDQSALPEKYTCEGESINPPLKIENLPEQTKSLVLIVDDPDAPSGRYDHWLCWNIPVDGTFTPVNIGEHSNPGISGINGEGKTGYQGACPPSGQHRYRFHLFALDDELDLEAGADRTALEAAMQGHVVGEGLLTGLYAHQNK